MAKRCRPTAKSARNRSSTASNTPIASRSCFAARRRRRFWRSSGSTPKAACPSRARPSVTTGPCPACRRPPTSRSPGSMRAGWSSSRFCQMVTAYAQGSSCTCRISPPTDRRRRTSWTKPFSTDASSARKMSPIPSRAALRRRLRRRSG